MVVSFASRVRQRPLPALWCVLTVLRAVLVRCRGG